MADVRKTVEIALQVKGIDLSSLNSLVTVLDKVQKSVDNATKSIQGLQTALSAIKTPPALDKVLTSLQAFEKIKIPSLTNIATGFRKLGEMKEPPNITKFVQSLEQFSNVKLPGVTAMVNGFKKMESINVAGITEKVKALNTALSDLDKRGGISAFKKFANDVSTMKTAFNDSAQATTKITKALDDVQSKAKETGGVLGSLGERIKTVFQFRIISLAFQSLTTGITQGLTAIVEYDQALKDLQAITGATTLEVAQMGAKIIEVASTTKFSASEVAQGMRTIGQAGFSASEAVETMQAVSDLATGTLSDMSTTVDLVTTAMRVFQIDATRSGDVADVFANAVNRSKLTVDKLRTAMNYVGPIARDSGVSFKELAASMGTLANSGLRASTIGTGLRRIFAELIDPSKKLKAAADEAGVALQELDPRTTSLQDVLSNLGLVIADASTAFDIFGKRGASAALSLTTAGSQFQVMLETVGKSGTAAQQAAIQMEGLGVSFKNLKDKLGLLAIAIGEAGLADALRVVINLSRTLVDAITALTDTGFGKLVVTLGIVTAAAYAFATAWGLVSAALGIPALVPMIANIGRLTAVLKLATVSVQGFFASLGPVGLAFTAVAAAIAYFMTTSNEAGEAAAVTADKYGVLTKRMEDYQLSIVGMKAGSQELKDENLSLRNSLFELANEYTDISKEAREAAKSIDPITGEIKKGGAAIDAYTKKLDAIQLDNLVKSGKEANDVIDKQGSVINRWVNKIYDDVKSVATLKPFDKLTTDTLLFAKEIDKGNVSIKEMEEVIASWDPSNLNTQQKVIIANYKALNEQSDKFVEYLLKSGKIGLDDSIGNIRKIAEDLGYVGPALDAAIGKIGLLKEANEDTFTNIIEKWSKDGIKDISKYVDKLNDLKGSESDAEAGVVRELLAERQALAEKQKLKKAEAAATAKNSDDKEAIWRAYFVEERAMLEQAAEIKRKLAENTYYQNSIVLQKESETLSRTLDENNIKYKHNAELRTKHNEAAMAKYLKNEQKLLAGQIVDTGAQDAAYEKNLQEREVKHAQYIENIALQEAKGVIAKEEADAQKLEADVAFYEKSLANALAHRDSISQADDKTLYDERNEEVLKAEERVAKARTRIIEELSKNIASINKDLLKEKSKVLKEEEKYADKQEEIAKSLADKLLTIEQDYTNKKIDIREALHTKLKSIDEEIARNRVETANNLLNVENSYEEKLRLARQSGLSDSQKDAQDRVAAHKYLAQGIALLSKAEKDKDALALKSGVELIKQGEGLAKGLEDQRDTIKVLNKAFSGMKKAANIEGIIKEFDLLKKKEEETKKAAEKEIKAKAAYDNKVKVATDANAAIAKTEDIRHKKAVKNLSVEIALIKKKKDVAEGRLDSFDAKSVADLAAIYEKNALAIGKETKAVKERTKEQDKSKDSVEQIFETLEDGARSFSDTFTTDEMSKGFTEFKDKGIDAFEAVKESGEDSVEGIADDLINEGERGWGSFADSAVKATKVMSQSFTNVSQSGVSSMKKVESQVNKIVSAMAKLKDKAITVAINYVTRGTPYTGKSNLATGGRIPGFGGGDRRPVLLEDGEWVINKFAVRKFGDSFMASLNNMTLPKFATGGRVGVPQSSIKSSSPLDALSNFGSINLDTGNANIPALVHRDVVTELTTHLNKLRRFGS